jgi:hypothetical protein
LTLPLPGAPTVRWWDLDSPRGCYSLWFICSVERSLRLITRRSHTSTRNMASLYWFGPPESNTLRPVVGVDCLRIGRGQVTRWIASSALYWPRMRSVPRLLVVVSYDQET